MYIKEIVIEGFKSYATRTVIRDFDTQFNAITGFNGSGKSNILDSILFVLGISKDWDLLRVKKVQELVYKQGHAGITKAEVTIVFDNSNKEQSPLGYEQCETISVTRQIQQEKSKYFVNGTKENQTKVKGIFRSVQLNIDNPHFLVAQGRITKIINLKPQELISMLEETAGTALYNEKKKESEKIIIKKDGMVKEINDLISSDIQPKMQKVKEERELYLIWKDNENEIRSMEIKIKAYDYYTKSNIKKDREKEFQLKLKDYQQGEKELNKINSEHLIIQEEIKKHAKKQDLENDERVKAIVQNINKKQADIQKEEQDRENFKKQQVQLLSEKKKNENKLNQCDQEIFKNEQDQVYKQQQIEDIKIELEQKKHNLNEFQKLVNDNSGKRDDSTKELVQEQISFAENKSKTIKTQIQNLEKTIQYKKDMIKKYQSNCDARENESTLLAQQIKQIQHEINLNEEDIYNSTFNINELKARESEKNSLDQQINALNHKIENSLNQNGNWIFKLQYKDPQPYFDRTKVKGRIFSLFTIKSPEYYEALETGAGGKLTYVVTDNEQTSKLMLKQNSFNFNVRFIPNNKIVGNTINQDVIQNAQQIASEQGGWAYPAYDLIEYDENLQKSMLFVFGNFIVCSSQNIARQIAFNTIKKLTFKCVTIEGDVFDPQGTLQGGYQDTKNLILSRYSIYRQLNDEREELVDQRRYIQESITDLKKQEVSYNELADILNNKKVKCEKLEQQLRNIESLGVQKHQQRLQSELANEEIILNSQKKQYEKAGEQITELYNEMKNFSQQSNAKKVLKSKVDNLIQQISNINKEQQEMSKDIEEFKFNIEKRTQQKKKVENQIVQQNEEFKDLKMKIFDKNQIIKDQKTKLQQLNAQKQQIEQDILKIQGKRVELESKERNLKNRKEEIENEQKKIEESKKKISSEVSELHTYLNNLERENEFIRRDKDTFGKQGSDGYDFSKVDFNRLKKQYQQTVQEQQIRQKLVNFKVEAMSEKVEKDYQSLIEKRIILENDKSILYKNMEELDKRKQETLEKCYLQVNLTFGQIFSDLLPGATARIQPPDGQDVSAGLELGVAFNKVWKNSLSELSGGQRSLLALSFVLALLKYKPAPFYILDEVDSALDLSHTENIGYMISQRFQNSQFILISLKDGMYQNANVLYKTSFVDGVSKVDRIPLKKKSNFIHKKKHMEVEYERHVY